MEHKKKHAEEFMYNLSGDLLSLSRRMFDKIEIDRFKYGLFDVNLKSAQVQKMIKLSKIREIALNIDSMQSDVEKMITEEENA